MIKKQEKSNPKFPNIFRFITENPLFKKVNHFQLKLALIGFISSFIFASIIIVSAGLYKDYQRKIAVDMERKKIEEQIKFWEKIAGEYRNYRDAYFKLAVLEYTLKNFDKSRYFLQKTLLIDPGFNKARELEKILVNR